MIHLLDYGAGNVRSVKNGIRMLGYEVAEIRRPEEILSAERIVFPGVGNFGVVMARLTSAGYVEPLVRRIAENKPLLGICVALQTFFEGSEEAPGIAGMGVIPGMVRKFDDSLLSVPQIGWNNIIIQKDSSIFDGYDAQKLYFVHSFYAEALPENANWILSTTNYGVEFVSAVQRGNITAFQFHPEKSLTNGVNLLKNFANI